MTILIAFENIEETVELFEDCNYDLTEEDLLDETLEAYYWVESECDFEVVSTELLIQLKGKEHRIPVVL